MTFFAVKPDLGAGTMKEFVALAKANPDKFNVSTPPIGTTPPDALNSGEPGYAGGSSGSGGSSG